MTTIQQILNKIKLMSKRTGAFSIGKTEFFDTLIDMTVKISEVNDNVNSVAKSLVWQPAVSIFSDLDSTYQNAQPGWAALVKNENTVYSYNGSVWANTGLTGFPKDVDLKSRNYVQLTDPASVLNNNVKDGDSWIYTGDTAVKYERVSGVWISMCGNNTGVTIYDADIINCNGAARLVINCNGDRNIILKSKN